MTDRTSDLSTSTSVFVDGTGRRGRRVRRLAYTVSSACVVYLLMIGITFASGQRTPMLELPATAREAAGPVGEVPADLVVDPAPAGPGGPVSQLSRALTSVASAHTGGTRFRLAAVSSALPATRSGVARASAIVPAGPRPAPAAPAPAAPVPAPAVPAPPDPSPADPAPSDPAPADPAPSNPTPTDPAPPDPAPADPVPDPTPSDPTPPDPTPPDPTPSDPAPSDPAPSDPAPPVPLPVELPPVVVPTLPVVGGPG